MTVFLVTYKAVPEYCPCHRSLRIGRMHKRSSSQYFVWLILYLTVYGQIQPDIRHVQPDIVDARPDMFCPLFLCPQQSETERMGRWDLDCPQAVPFVGTSQKFTWYLKDSRIRSRFPCLSFLSRFFFLFLVLVAEAREGQESLNLSPLPFL